VACFKGKWQYECTVLTPGIQQVCSSTGHSTGMQHEPPGRAVLAIRMDLPFAVYIIRMSTPSNTSQTKLLPQFVGGMPEAAQQQLCTNLYAKSQHLPCTLSWCSPVSMAAAQGTPMCTGLRRMMCRSCFGRLVGRHPLPLHSRGRSGRRSRQLCSGWETGQVRIFKIALMT